MTLIPEEGVEFVAVKNWMDQDDAFVTVILHSIDTERPFVGWFHVEYNDGSKSVLNGPLHAKRPARVEEVLAFLRVREGLHMPEVDAASERQANTAENTHDA